MDFNTLLLRLGIDTKNFVNKYNEPIQIEHGLLYEVEQDPGDRICPHCKQGGTQKIGYFYTETKCSESDNFIDILRIKKVRLKCKHCGKTYTPPVAGINRKFSISQQVENFIFNDFFKPITFADIANKYGITKSRVIQIFDKKVPIVLPREMPEVLCIDEIRFCEELDQKYCCVLYDFTKKEIVDIIKNRQMPYLKDYFGKISLEQRENTKVFISDMYDGYDSVCNNYFPKAIHIVDMFHVVIQLSRAVNTLRVKTMQGYTAKNDHLYNFMKTNWKLFLCREENIPDKTYTSSKTGEVYHFDDLLYKCIALNKEFQAGYLALQDLFHFSYYMTFEEATTNMEFLINKLNAAESDILQKVADTYKKWKTQIANAFSQKVKEIRYTNAIAESINNQLKTIIKNAYGYHNFERFKKRALMIITYAKTYNKK